MTALVFIDTETTGLHHERQAWEVAAVRREATGEESRHHWFIAADDLRLDLADPQALRIGRFYHRHPDYVDDALAAVVTQQAAARQIERVTRDAQLVGSNPAFDAATLDPMLREHGLCPAWDYRLIDVAALAAGYLMRDGHGFVPAWRSYQLSESIGVPRPTEGVAHTAMGDVLWTRDLFDTITTGGVR